MKLSQVRVGALILFQILLPRYVCGHKELLQINGNINDITNFVTLNVADSDTHGTGGLHFSSLLSTNHTNSGTFATFIHPQYPQHQLRIKKSEFCDPTVNVYTGYLDVDYGTKHMFFFFYESRRSPDTDDVMMWLNGGPGGSSSMGMLMELGPCNIDMSNSSANGTTWNPHSWNNEANIFFLDQPVGVGFSWAEQGQTVGTTEAAAKHVAAFIRIFFETFKQFEGRRIHLTGESYGGHYLPIFASELYDQNTLARAEGRPEINIASVIIGNGGTDISTLYSGRFEIECGRTGTSDAVHDITTCVRMRKALPRCQEGLKMNCIDIFDEMNCRAAVGFCETDLGGLWGTDRNPYDVTKKCLGDNLCYLEIPAIEVFLNSSSTRALLGLNKDNFPFDYAIRSPEVGEAFDASMDMWATPVQFYVAELLARHVPVLLYAGTYDAAVGWDTNRMWVERLEWAGRDAFNEKAWRTWNVTGQPVGVVKSEGPMTLASVWGAGHMVPHDKPVEASAMISRWLADTPL